MDRKAARKRFSKLCLELGPPAAFLPHAGLPEEFDLRDVLPNYNFRPTHVEMQGDPPETLRVHYENVSSAESLTDDLALAANNVWAIAEIFSDVFVPEPGNTVSEETCTAIRLLLTKVGSEACPRELLLTVGVGSDAAVAAIASDRDAWLEMNDDELEMNLADLPSDEDDSSDVSTGAHASASAAATRSGASTDAADSSTLPAREGAGSSDDVDRPSDSDVASAAAYESASRLTALAIIATSIDFRSALCPNLVTALKDTGLNDVHHRMREGTSLAATGDGLPTIDELLASPGAVRLKREGDEGMKAFTLAALVFGAVV